MRASAILALLLLSACDQPVQPAKPLGPGLEVKPSWVFGLGPNSAEISYLDSADTTSPQLRLICAAGDGFLIVARDLVPVDSEERLTIGAGDVAHALVASKAEAGVKAAGPIDDELLAILGGPDPIKVNHGSQNIGPFTPPAAVRRVFAENCRKLSAKGQV